jgi:hypothetical protein
MDIVQRYLRSLPYIIRGLTISKLLVRLQDKFSSSCGSSQLFPHTRLRLLGRQDCGLEDEIVVSSSVSGESLPWWVSPSSHMGL